MLGSSKSATLAVTIIPVTSASGAATPGQRESLPPAHVVLSCVYGESRRGDAEGPVLSCSGLSDQHTPLLNESPS